MKNFKKVAIVLMVLMLAMALTLASFACVNANTPSAQDGDATPGDGASGDATPGDGASGDATPGEGDDGDTFVGFVLEVRKYNGGSMAGANIDGTLLATLQVPVAEGQSTVADALTAVATNEGDQYKLSFSDTDYLLFSSAWWLSNGFFAAETGYVANDYAYSYMACDGVMSSGPTVDAVTGLSVFTIVIDGWDGTIGA